MVDSAALLVDEVLPHQSMRQWVLTVPFPLRFLLASQPAVIGQDVPVPRSTGMCESGHGQSTGYRLPRHCHASDP